ncbi:hypothetical protein GCM10010121_094210 [Streptomyces brasiliensis]|uniref:Uncharacterized protein n=1 Tax=Streptomyces brasiliensis TaxID=1954 RepID=A0A917PAG5_9ACTN|nr:hypothetical protein GCM10010121_094210 [Streptomyces brasiliensis]
MKDASLLLDASSASPGLETASGVTMKIIERNDNIPTRRSGIFLRGVGAGDERTSRQHSVPRLRKALLHASDPRGVEALTPTSHNTAAAFGVLAATTVKRGAVPRGRRADACALTATTPPCRAAMPGAVERQHPLP